MTFIRLYQPESSPASCSVVVNRAASTSVGAFKDISSTNKSFLIGMPPEMAEIAGWTSAAFSIASFCSVAIASAWPSAGTSIVTLKASRSSTDCRMAADAAVARMTSLPFCGTFLMHTRSVCSTTFEKRGPMRTYL